MKIGRFLECNLLFHDNFESIGEIEVSPSTKLPNFISRQKTTDTLNTLVVGLEPEIFVKDATCFWKLTIFIFAEPQRDQQIFITAAIHLMVPEIY